MSTFSYCLHRTRGYMDHGCEWCEAYVYISIRILYIYVYINITKTNCGCGHAPVVSAPLKFRVTARYWFWNYQPQMITIPGYATGLFLWMNNNNKKTLAIDVICPICRTQMPDWWRSRWSRLFWAAEWLLLTLIFIHYRRRKYCRALV